MQIKTGDDLLETITEYCQKNRVKTGIILAIGALQKANLSYYDQLEKKYTEIVLNQPLEILSCLGNISLKEGKEFVHAHLSVADKKGNSFGGHLNKGCVVFACECLIIETEGESLQRIPDSLTGLSLWEF